MVRYASRCSALTTNGKVRSSPIKGNQMRKLLCLLSLLPILTLTTTYQDAGVDIKAADNLVTYIRQLTNQKSIGEFGASIDLKHFAYSDPLLLCSTDGVGTKLLIAQEVNDHNTIGIDLVAMNVNDILVHGGQPIGFLDYIATGKLEKQSAQEIINGIVAGCNQAGCALLGGETAEMPGLYYSNHYDLAGFTLGLVEKQDYLPKKETMQPGDVVIGIASNGIYANGFSLLRYVIAREGCSLYAAPPFRSNCNHLHQELLKPTKIYVQSVLPLMRDSLIKGAAHITGGGLPNNIARVLPDALGVKLDMTNWHIPPVFGWLQNAGNIVIDEMLQTFNMGIGFILIVDQQHAQTVLNRLYDVGERADIIGSVTPRTKNSPVIIENKKIPSYKTEYILVIGSGAREHALAHTISRSETVQRVIVAPGNGGTNSIQKTYNTPINAIDIRGITQFCLDEYIDLVIIGPEAPLVSGIVDECKKHGIRCLGPSQQAAQIEISKIFAKEFMQRHDIPTAQYKTFDLADDAIVYARNTPLPLVIKADGITAGKGVIIAHTQEQAIFAINSIMRDKMFGEAGKRIVIEQFLTGTEVSFFAITDGQHVIPLSSAQDYKQLCDGNNGPNTGGMGAISPSPLITSEMQKMVMDTIMIPAVRGMHHEGTPYVGFLYAGLMITPDGEPTVLEFNCRLGDPETEVMLMRLKSDFVQLCNAALDGTLDNINIEWSKDVAVGVMLASNGYPTRYPKNEIITGLNELTDCTVFHAGTKKDNDQVLTNGGRVLCVCALGTTYPEAREKIYQQIDMVKWPAKYYRKDIGK